MQTHFFQSEQRYEVWVERERFYLLFSHRPVNWEKCFAREVAGTETILKQNSGKKGKQSERFNRFFTCDRQWYRRSFAIADMLVMNLLTVNRCDDDYHFRACATIRSWWKRNFQMDSNQALTKRNDVIMAKGRYSFAHFRWLLWHRWEWRWNELVMCVIWINVCACVRWPSHTAMFLLNKIFGWNGKRLKELTIQADGTFDAFACCGFLSSAKMTEISFTVFVSNATATAIAITTYTASYSKQLRINLNEPNDHKDQKKQQMKKHTVLNEKCTRWSNEIESK